MNTKFYPCIWFDHHAKEAADFYCRVFSNSNIVSENSVVTMWELEGQRMMGLNGGSNFVANPSISFFVICESREELDELWDKISIGAKIMMALTKYEWSEYYGFIQDKFGISWQFYMGAHNETKQKIVPALLFTDNKFGKANEAMQFYANVFPSSKVDSVSFYDEEKTIVKHAEFQLNGNVFKVMDGAGNHNFSFNEAISFVIECDIQEQIDYYWNAFTADGGEESMCGWCKDKFGVSWQIVPSILGKLMSNADKGQKVMEAFMQMKKFELEVLLNI
jgi:predicted 3-demethylubiquinone-9 3-methyltransferase (glyoxalase superfamily)